ncbi:sensor histidine kinase [Jeotgalibacillus haloalkalitolerans]|uniref:Histidine kinase n=1 Tax=Jeotgalibacillus haloalkalitolerans TaxID=3104292 RepID=A0ABU5KJA6_9BACL|nr:histidine kinase [Jeotgalibacillus sp. HH7-29]MDZ5711339.1 histidine kinase [Jeotgalibacillus sp. HH7-29]
MRKQLEDTLEARWLQAQIQPHFIFNTLNSISALSDIDPIKMQHLIGHFSDLLRSKFDTGSLNRFTSLQEELSITESYLFIEKVRFGKRLKIIWDIDEDISEFFQPTLTIQPIVENALKHGVVKQTRGDTIEVRAEKDQYNMKITIKDDGIGMKKETVDYLNTMKFEESHRIGITNTNRRLKKAFGKGLRIKSEVGAGTEVSFIIFRSYG